MKKVVAVDFDGTLHFGEYPFIGEPNQELIDFIKEHQHEYVWILWTSRAGKQLSYAKNWLREQGVKFHHINNNSEQYVREYRNNSRKVYADIYIDDRAYAPKNFKDAF